MEFLKDTKNEPQIEIVHQNQPEHREDIRPVKKLESLLEDNPSTSIDLKSTIKTKRMESQLSLVDFLNECTEDTISPRPEVEQTDINSQRNIDGIKHNLLHVNPGILIGDVKFDLSEQISERTKELDLDHDSESDSPDIPISLMDFLKEEPPLKKSMKKSSKSLRIKTRNKYGGLSQDLYHQNPLSNSDRQDLTKRKSSKKTDKNLNLSEEISFIEFLREDPKPKSARIGRHRHDKKKSKSFNKMLQKKKKLLANDPPKKPAKDKKPSSFMEFFEENKDKSPQPTPIEQMENPENDGLSWLEFLRSEVPLDKHQTIPDSKTENELPKEEGEEEPILRRSTTMISFLLDIDEKSVSPVHRQKIISTIVETNIFKEEEESISLLELLQQSHVEPEPAQVESTLHLILEGERKEAEIEGVDYKSL